MQTNQFELTNFEISAADTTMNKTSQVRVT